MVSWQSAEMYLPTLSCRPERVTAVTSCFKNNFCVAGSSLYMLQCRELDPNMAQQDSELLLALGKSTDTSVLAGSCLQREGKGTDLPQEKREGKERLKPNQNTTPRNPITSAYDVRFPAGVHLCTPCKTQDQSSLNNPNSRKEK